MATKKNEAAEVTSVPEAFSETLKIALYGRFGSGKTEQIAALIQRYGADKVKVVSCERGLNTVQSVLPKSSVIVANSLNEMREAYKPCLEFATTNPTGWVVVDGMSQATEWLANEQLSGAERYYDAKAQNQSIAQKDMPFGRFLTDRGAIDSMRIYGRIGRDSENLLAAWIGLPCNLYINYLEEMVGQSGYEKSLPYGPDVPGKVGLRAVMSSFDYIGRLFYKDFRDPQTNETVTILCAGFDPRNNVYMARVRTDRRVVAAPTEIADFDITQLIDIVKPKEKEDAQAQMSEAKVSGQ